MILRMKRMVPEQAGAISQDSQLKGNLLWTECFSFLILIPGVTIGLVVNSVSVLFSASSARPWWCCAIQPNCQSWVMCKRWLPEVFPAVCFTASRSCRSDGTSLVDLGHYWTCLFVRKNRGYVPVKAFCPLSSMLIASVRIFSLDKNPPFYRPGRVEPLHWLALREGRTSSHELSGGNLVISGLERPVHQESHR